MTNFPHTAHYVHQDPPPPYSEATGNPTIVLTPIPVTQNATIITVPPPRQQQVILIGNCPVCRVGVLKTRPTCLGILLCVLFFPFVFTGLCFLFLLQEAYCPNCGASA